MNGFTFYICFGKYGGWRWGFDGPALRIVCGWVAIVIALRDIEQDINTLLKAANQALEPTCEGSADTKAVHSGSV